MYSYSEFVHHNAKSYYAYKRPLSRVYRVLVNGEEIPVYTCNISKYPFNRVWPGHQRMPDQMDTASFVNIVSDEKIKIEIITNFKYEKVYLKPFSEKIEYCDEGGKISFHINKNGNYVLECDSYHNCLYIFNSKPITAPKKEQVTYYFGAGIHFPGKIKLNSNESVYVDKDALVYGSIYAEKAENIHIFGNGILDDSHEERTGNYCYEEYTNGNLKFYECSGIQIEGIGMMNSAIWCINLFACMDVMIDGIKVFGQWRYNTDGVDIVNCQNVFVRNSFVHSFDDSITIKAIDKYYYIDNKNIHIDNCILWCDWGKCCEVGIETACREYRDISFTKCDILRAGHVALDISNGECAEISYIRFENINVEYNRFDTEPVYQDKEEMVYEAENKIAVPTLIAFNNIPWRTPKCMEEWGLPPITGEINLEGIKMRNIHDIRVKNICVYYEEGIPLIKGKPDIRIRIENQDNKEAFKNIDITDIFVNGKMYTRV